MSVEQLSPWLELELPQSVNSALENVLSFAYLSNYEYIIYINRNYINF